MLEADCLICHLKGYNWKARALAVRGGFFYEAPMVGAGWFKCCEPFDLSHNVVSGKHAIGSRGCKDCHTEPSPFFNRKVLIDPFNRDGRPVYKEQWEIFGYSKNRTKELTREQSVQPEVLKK